MSIESQYTKGTLVVGSYNQAGTAIEESVVLGDNTRLQNSLRQDAASKGGKIRSLNGPVAVATKKKGGKKKPKVETPVTFSVPMRTAYNPLEGIPQDELDTLNTITASMQADANVAYIPTVFPITTVIPKVVIFKHSIGEIKLDVEAIMIDNLGIGLVFANDREVRFKPNQGDEFTLITPDAEFTVMFTGVVLTWLDGVKKIMVLVNVEGKGELANDEY